MISFFSVLVLLGCFPCSEKTDLNKLLGIPQDFQPNYEIVSYDEDANYRSHRRMIERKVARITVPEGLSKGELEFNLKHAAMKVYETYKPDALMIFAYKEGDKTQSTYTAGRCVFAPYGKWENANKKVPLKDYKAAIDIKDSYFKPTVKILPRGAKVKLKDKYSNRVGISKTPDSFVDEDIIFQVPNGTPATIIGHDKWTEDLVVHKVRVKYGGKNRVGWVSAGDIISIK